MHTEPRAARLFCLQVDRRGPVIVAVIPLNMQFSIWQICLLTAYAAGGLAITQIFDASYAPLVTYLMLGVGIGLSKFQAAATCPSSLFFRWHIIPLLVAFYASFYGFAYGAIGPWQPPASYVAVFLWVPIWSVMQVAKFQFVNKPNIELRLTQLIGSWTIVTLNAMSLAIGRYVGL